MNVGCVIYVLLIFIAHCLVRQSILQLERAMNDYDSAAPKDIIYIHTFNATLKLFLVLTLIKPFQELSTATNGELLQCARNVIEFI